MKDYVIVLQDVKSLSTKMILVKGATSVDNAEEKAEQGGWLKKHAIISTRKVSGIVE